MGFKQLRNEQETDEDISFARKKALQHYFYNSYFNVFAVDHVEGHGVEDESVEDLAEDLAVPDPLVEVLFRNFLQQVDDVVKSLVFQLNISLSVK